MLASCCSVALLHGSWCGSVAHVWNSLSTVDLQGQGVVSQWAQSFSHWGPLNMGWEVWAGFWTPTISASLSLLPLRGRDFQKQFLTFLFFLQISTCLTSKVAARTSDMLPETYLVYRRHHNREATVEMILPLTFCVCLPKLLWWGCEHRPLNMLLLGAFHARRLLWILDSKLKLFIVWGL